MIKQKFTTTIWFIVVTIGLGLFLSWLTLDTTTRKLSENALEQARIVAHSINREQLASLKGNAADSNSDAYLNIKEQLFKIRNGHSRCRFLYLMGRKTDGKVFFFLDSQPADAEDYATPGLIYDEISPEYLQTFRTGKEQTVGPIKDRWGTLVTSLVPIYDNNSSDKMLAVLGMDIEANDWAWQTLNHCLLPTGLSVFIVALTTLVFMVNRNRIKLNQQYREKEKLTNELQLALNHVQQLQGILPICSNCKKIRDDMGCWNQIESYISKHSEADFSHGICPECAQELYGDLKYLHQESCNADNNT